MSCVNLAIGILRWVGAASLPPPPQPHHGHAAGGAGSRGAPRSRNGLTTAPFACECQSFLDNVIAGLAQIGAWNDPRGVAPRCERTQNRVTIERLGVRTHCGGRRDPTA
jgi:hypothetical protein